MALNLSPIANDAPFLDANGNPLSGGLLYTYTAGSTTAQTTYTDSTGNTQNANPIVLNSNGYPSNGSSVVGVWLTAGVSYKFVLKTSGGTTVWTRDQISGINDTNVTQDQWASGPTPTYVSATSFTLSGDQTSTFHVGRRIKTTNSGGTIYSTITSSTYGASTTIVVANDSGTLDSGLSAVSYGLMSAANTSEPQIGDSYVCQGRLTLETGVPVSTTDQTAKTSIYFAPFRGNKVDLYDNTALRWVRYKFTELTLAVPATTATMYDVFLYNNAGTLTLEATAWTNDTTRATSLTTQDGVYVKSGSTNKRYLGSFRTTGVSGQTEDSLAKRYVWNYYNRVSRPMRVTDSTDSWNYTTATIRQANGAAANQLDMVIGVSEDQVYAEVQAHAQNTSADVNVVAGVGLDSTSALASGFISRNFFTQDIGFSITVGGTWRGFPGVGRHYLAWLEYSAASGTTTWLGDNGLPTLMQSGIHGDFIG